MIPKLVVTAVSILIVSGAAHAGETVHWSYAGADGPQRWGELSPTFASCSQGKNQSPIDVTGSIEADLAPIEFSYRGYATDILHNGHTVQMNFTPSSNIAVAGRDFELKQLHFHTPSENHINGESFPAEVHLVHADSSGALAVIGVMLRTGKENDALSELWSKLPHAKDATELLPKFAASILLPESRDYYRFNGSLTTPPCSEGVMWLLMKSPLVVSESQLDALNHALGLENNRDVQSVNARPILQ